MNLRVGDEVVRGWKELVLADVKIKSKESGIESWDVKQVEKLWPKNGNPNWCSGKLREPLFFEP
jgi:hypothetical protein